MKKKREEQVCGNILKLFSSHLKTYKGESKRSYQKAFSSLQIYIISNYSMRESFDGSLIENWVVDNYLQGLSGKTISFYLEKIASLYSNISNKVIGGKAILFKEIKTKLKNVSGGEKFTTEINLCVEKYKSLRQITKNGNSGHPLLVSLLTLPITDGSESSHKIKFDWACVALKGGIKPNLVRSVIKDIPDNLNILNITSPVKVPQCEKIKIAETIKESLQGEKLQWFALRLRPKFDFEDLLSRFSLFENEIKVPELFYPNEEIARKIGRKVVWKGKPVIRDVVFFKMRKSDIYNMLTYLYDIAWCYRNPGRTPGNYAAIPARAMEDFKKSLGMLTPDFEVGATGELALKPGDEVVIVNGEYLEKKARILKKPGFDKDGNKIYRVSLIDCNGRWDIGIDARLIRKC